jgi:hypothetical protein
LNVNVIRRQIVFRPVTRLFFMVSCLFCFASFPGGAFLLSGSNQVLPWVSLIFIVIIALQGVLIGTTLLLAIHERPVTIRRDIPNPNYREREL